MTLPTAEDIMHACDRVGVPRGIDTCYSWRCGRVRCPAWALVAISAYTGCNLADLTRELASRWYAKQGLPFPAPRVTDEDRARMARIATAAAEAMAAEINGR